MRRLRWLPRPILFKYARYVRAVLSFRCVALIVVTDIMLLGSASLVAAPVATPAVVAVVTVLVVLPRCESNRQASALSQLCL